VWGARASKKLTPVLDENPRQWMNINHFGEYHHGKLDLRVLPGVLACFLHVKAGTNSVYFEWI
jgi:hypothetical protein